MHNDGAMSETLLWEQASGQRELAKVVSLSAAIQASKGAAFSSSFACRIAVSSAYYPDSPFKQPHVSLAMLPEPNSNSAVQGMYPAVSSRSNAWFAVPSKQSDGYKKLSKRDIDS
jgi:hypothetical protein